MRTIRYLIQKEFIQIFRNRTLLPIIFVMPLVQMLVLVFAANQNLKRIDFAIYDQDNTVESRNLVNSYEHSPFFFSSGDVNGEEIARDLLKSGKVDMIIVIPRDFEKNLSDLKPVSVQFQIDGINSAAGVIMMAYAQNILFNHNKQLMPKLTGMDMPKRGIDIVYNHWYNPELDFKIYMVPGILVILVTMIAWILGSLNIVREKELGTIEQVNVTPVKKYQFIVGKLVPFWIIAMFELAFGLILGKLIFAVPILGSLGLLFVFTSVYLLVALGIGLFISSISTTQQQVMFLNFFFILTFVMMSGIFTPAESMPNWAHLVNYLNPLSYFMKVIRMLMLKGAGFVEILPEFISVAIYGVVMIFLATFSYRKTS